tara:strand:- start:758 stop:1423 length:666 start_codon:yes stop_codon:yes gene_type:complete
MLVDKPEHSLFLPDLVVGELLPKTFPPRRGDNAQLDSLQWLITASRAFVASSSLLRLGRAGNFEAQPLQQREVDDTRHLTVWAASVMQPALKTKSPRPTLFIDEALPMLRNLAFRHSENALIKYLQTLRYEFYEVMHGALQINPAKETKASALELLKHFETADLPRYARTTVSRALARSKVLFGGMIFACAFSLAMIRLIWMERKVELCDRMGIRLTKGKR